MKTPTRYGVPEDKDRGFLFLDGHRWRSDGKWTRLQRYCGTECFSECSFYLRGGGVGCINGSDQASE